ncbi:MAG TPA: hypothetical protein DEG17_22335 [Cyanobacteria bacterium UBA11149]|nr:hypothetical protein [Cyanobacteria bacterium UBA11366]HBS68190.1 hypothetical protein [Cyanobacteria bacterium UBA11153]HBW91520.1 hypothetical protein [Cyanobacteria bacterium UBA11149]
MQSRRQGEAFADKNSGLPDNLQVQSRRQGEAFADKNSGLPNNLQAQMLHPYQEMSGEGASGNDEMGSGVGAKDMGDKLSRKQEEINPNASPCFNDEMGCKKVQDWINNNEIYGKKYHRQVISDCQNFQPGLTLLENLNTTIQGIIDLEQTKSDRALDDTIAIAGIGLAISGLTATAISIQQPAPTSYTNFSFLTSPVFILSLLPSAPFLIILLYRLLRRFFNR